jgi:hypothetical protein
VGTIAPLPPDLSALSPAEIRAAINARRSRLTEIFAGPPEEIGAAAAAEAKSLNDDLGRLNEQGQPHPGHQTRRRVGGNRAT